MIEENEFYSLQELKTSTLFYGSLGELKKLLPLEEAGFIGFSCERIPNVYNKEYVGNPYWKVKLYFSSNDGEKRKIYDTFYFSGRPFHLEFGIPPESTAAYKWSGLSKYFLSEDIVEKFHEMNNDPYAGLSPETRRKYGPDKYGRRY